MLSSKVFFNALLKRKSPLSIKEIARYCSNGGFYDELYPVGKREVVGYAANSMPSYIDRIEYPYPSVRYRETTGDIIPLKQKEKGDWKLLSIDEKKKLYRASFCHTFAEIQAPNGEWKSILGLTLMTVSFGLILFILEKLFVYKPRPETFNEENRQRLLRRMLVNKDSPLFGYPSKWDYEKDTWK